MVSFLQRGRLVEIRDHIDEFAGTVEASRASIVRPLLDRIREERCPRNSPRIGVANETLAADARGLGDRSLHVVYEELAWTRYRGSARCSAGAACHVSRHGRLRARVLHLAIGSKDVLDTNRFPRLTIALVGRRRRRAERGGRSGAESPLMREFVPYYDS